MRLLPNGIAMRANYREVHHSYLSSTVKLYEPPPWFGALDLRLFIPAMEARLSASEDWDLEHSSYTIPWGYAFWRKFDQETTQAWFRHYTQYYWRTPLTAFRAGGSAPNRSLALADLVLGLILEEGWKDRLGTVGRVTSARVQKAAKRAVAAGCSLEAESIMRGEPRAVLRAQEEYAESVKVRASEYNDHLADHSSAVTHFDDEARRRVAEVIATIMAARVEGRTPAETFTRLIEGNFYFLVPPRFSKKLPLSLVPHQNAHEGASLFSACTLGPGDILERITPPVRDKAILMRLVRSPQDRLESLERGDQHCPIPTDALLTLQEMADLINEFQVRLDAALSLIKTAQVFLRPLPDHTSASRWKLCPSCFPRAFRSLPSNH